MLNLVTICLLLVVVVGAATAAEGLAWALLDLFEALRRRRNGH